jgi:hypothetical protein
MAINCSHLFFWWPQFADPNIDIMKKIDLGLKYVIFFVQSILVYASYKKNKKYIYPLLYLQYFRLLFPLLDFQMRTEQYTPFENSVWLFKQYLGIVILLIAIIIVSRFKTYFVLFIVGEFFTAYSFIKFFHLKEEGQTMIEVVQ